MRKAFRYCFTGASLFILILNIGCQNNEDLGFNLTTKGERFHFKIDTLSTLSAATFRQDSLTSEKRTSSLVGCMNDPVFGRSTAGFLTQLRLSSNNVDFGDDIKVDSVVLLLKYQSYYGDTNNLQRIRVYELTQDLYYDSTYYSNINAGSFIDPAKPVADFSYYPTPKKDSVLIRISDDIGMKILTADTASLSNNPNFIKFFKGLYLEAQPTDEPGSIIYYNLSGGKSRLTLYYSNSTQDSLQYEVVINSNATWVNLFSHSYDGKAIEPYINDSAGTHDQFYLQGMSGLRGYLQVNLSDTLKELIDKGIAINKAELILKVPDDPDAAFYERPKSLRVFIANTNGTNGYIKDLALGEEYYGGFFNSDNRTYSFNIGRYIQDIAYPVKDKRSDNTGLFLVLADERTTANRLVMDNRAAAMKLIITYTPLN